MTLQRLKKSAKVCIEIVLEMVMRACAKIIAMTDSLLDPHIKNNKHPNMIKTPAEMTS